jgi:hypothetical protein
LSIRSRSSAERTEKLATRKPPSIDQLFRFLHRAEKTKGH